MAVGRPLYKDLLGIPNLGPEAACAGHSDPLWDWDATRAQRAEAVLICMGCPVIRACGEYAARHTSVVGVWAGEYLAPRRD